MEYGVAVAWWVLYLVLFVVGTPIVARVLPDTPDSGAFVAMPTVVGMLALVSLWVGQVSYGPIALGIAVVAVLVASMLSARGGVAVAARPYLETLAVFTVAFAFMLLIRAAALGIYPGGGEKFLDFGLLQSLLRADYLPPEDMWFAGKRVVYYYGGHLMAATLAKLAGTPGRFAWAPALSGFYAMAVTGVYGLASAIADRRGFPRVRSAAFAGVFYGLASNLLTPARVYANLVPRDVVVWIAAAANRRSGGVYDIEPGEVAIGPHSFDYWTASRVIPGTINEFPFFTYFNGEMHPHAMSVPTMLVGAAVLYAYWRTPAERAWRRRALLVGVLPPAVGVLLFVNTWSFPTALGLTALVVALAPASPWSLLPDRLAALDPGARIDGPRDGEWRDGEWRDDPRGRLLTEAGRILLGVLLAVVVAILAVAWVAPFVENVLLGGIRGRHVAFLPDRSSLGPFLLVHGGFLLVFVPYLLSRAGATTRRAAAVLVALPALAALGTLWTVAGPAIVGPLVLVGWYLLRRERAGFGTLLLVAGAGLVVLVEFVYLADQAAPGRFNTVFKTYAQVWTFWSVAAGVGLGAITARGETRLPVSARTRSLAADAFAVFLLVSLSVYGAFALAGHFSTVDDLTIDGYEYAREYHPNEVAAIEWVNDLEGQPNIVSAPGWDAYTWENPASSLTGVPTVVGWVHEQIYRGAAAYNQRVRDVRIIFQTEEARSRAILLDKYDVQYIYVGPREKARFHPGDLAAEPGIRRAFAAGNVTIYAVNQSALVGV